MPAIRGSELRKLLESEGAPKFHRHLSESLRSGDIKPYDFSVKDLAENLIDNGREWLNLLEQERDGGGGVRLLESSAVSTANFANTIGQIVYSAILQEAMAPEFLGPQLVNTIPTNYVTGEKLPGVTEIGDKAENIGEGHPYPMLSVNEKWIEIPPTKKRGGIVPITREVILADRTNVLLDHAKSVGRSVAIAKEKEILDVVMGLHSTINWKRNGSTGIAIYQTTTPYDNVTATNALVDWTDVENAMLTLAAMTDLDTGEPIMVMPKQLLCATGLQFTAKRVVGATEIRFGDGASNTTQAISPNPVPGLQVLSTSYVDNRMSNGSLATTTWFLGDFKAAFAYMENWPITVTQAPSNSEAEFTSDIVFRFKASERGTAAVLNPQYVTKCTA